MGEYFEQLPEKVKVHVKEIARTSGLPPGRESEEKIARGWIEKKRIFEEFTANLEMDDVDFLQKDDGRGALALTYSGSLIKLGPIVDGVRNAQYVSIGMRQDVPDAAEKDGSRLARDAVLDEPIEFEVGPVKSTSPLLKVAVLEGRLSLAEQEQRVTEATKLLEQEFLEVNRTLHSE